eukprot:gene8991-biopygen2471
MRLSPPPRRCPNSPATRQLAPPASPTAALRATPSAPATRGSPPPRHTSPPPRHTSPPPRRGPSNSPTPWERGVLFVLAGVEGKVSAKVQRLRAPRSAPEHNRTPPSATRSTMRSAAEQPGNNPLFELRNTIL